MNRENEACTHSTALHMHPRNPPQQRQRTVRKCTAEASMPGDGGEVHPTL